MIAVVLVRDQPRFLQECLDALSSQTVKPDLVVLLDLRPIAEQSPLAEAAALGLEVTTVMAKGEPESLELRKLLSEGVGSGFEFFWLLTEDCLPAQGSLRAMLAEFELSPSLAQVAPKLLHRDQTRRILSLGLSAGHLGDVLPRHADEYDQGQYDSDSDVLAAAATGSLYRTNHWLGVEFETKRLDSLFSTVATALQLRASGKRIAVAPRAWLSAAPLEVSSFEALRVGFALRLALSHPLVRLLWILLLPIEGLVRAAQQLVLKQTAAVFPTLGFGPWFWFSLAIRLRELQHYFAISKTDRRSLRPLLASASEIKLRRSNSRDELLETSPLAGQPGFIESGTFWFTLLPLLLSLPLLPLGVHAAGLGFAPLSPTVTELFDSYQLNPAAAWLLPLLSLFALLPGEPAAAFAWLLFFVPAIAFVSSWQFFRSIAGVRAISLIAALAYSLSPLLFNARTQGLPLIAISAAVLPWVLLAVFRLSQTSGTARRWRWSAVAALLLAFVAALTPLSLPLVAVFVLGLTLRRKLGLQWWFITLIPAVAVLLPRGLRHSADPVAFFAGWDAIDSATRAEPNLWSSWLSNGLTSGFLVLSGLMLLVIVANLLQPNPKSLTVFALASATLASQLIVEGSEAWANSTAVLLLTTSLLNNLVHTRSRIATIGNFSMVSILLLAVPTIVQPVSTEWRGDSRVTPAIVHAAAAINPSILTLVLDASDSEISSHLQLGNGTHLDQQLNQSDILLSHQTLPLNPIEQAQLSAALAAGSTEEASKLLFQGRISFVLLTGEDVEVRTNLESSGLLESAGVTEWGRLWRVRDAVQNSVQPVTPNPAVTANLALLAIYALLAAPTPGSFRRRRSDASIFVEGDDPQ